jgi:hypothetical protein
MVTELGGSVFEITHDLVGDLFRAKNAGVTPAKGLRGTVFGIFAEREVAGAERSFLRNNKKEERSKQPIENLSEVSSQKSEKSCSG